MVAQATGSLPLNRLTHTRVWNAIDALARRYSLSASGLRQARRARSHLVQQVEARDRRGPPALATRPRASPRCWRRPAPSFEDFTALVTAEPRGARPAQPIPLIGLTQAGAGGFFDDGGFPVGQGWDQIRFPQASTTRTPTRSK